MRKAERSVDENVPPLHHGRKRFKRSNSSLSTHHPSPKPLFDSILPSVKSLRSPLPNLQQFSTISIATVRSHSNSTNLESHFNPMNYFESTSLASVETPSVVQDDGNEELFARLRLLESQRNDQKSDLNFKLENLHLIDSDQENSNHKQIYSSVDEILQENEEEEEVELIIETEMESLEDLVHDLASIALAEQKVLVGVESELIVQLKQGQFLGF